MSGLLTHYSSAVLLFFAVTKFFLLFRSLHFTPILLWWCVFVVEKIQVFYMTMNYLDIIKKNFVSEFG